jgi:hypothetical protein
MGGFPSPFDLLGGGGGNSASFSGGGIGSSASTTATESIDGRISGGANGSAQSTIITGEGNTLNLTDAGAVHDSLALALAGVTQANMNTAATIKNQSDLQQSFTGALENIKTSDVRVLIVGALAVVCIVAFNMLKKAA